MRIAVTTVIFLSEKYPCCKLLICQSVWGTWSCHSVVISDRLLFVKFHYCPNPAFSLLIKDIIYEGFPSVSKPSLR